jgi:DNA-binding MarR family transcriptional regulator
MSTPEDSVNADRQRLVEAVLAASGASSTMAVFFHGSIAEQFGLGATEMKALLLLSGAGSLTAGEIAHHIGVTTPSVTTLIDRLEAKGYVRRVRDTRDRRRVIVERDEPRFARLAQVFGSLQENFRDFLAAYTNDQLITIADFLQKAVQRSQEFIAARQWQSSGEATAESRMSK